MATNGRPSTVRRHPQLSRIIADLDSGVSYAEVGTKYGLSHSAVGRFAISRKSELVKMIDGQPSIDELVPRLIDVADHAQEFRRQSRVAGSAVQQSRAIKAESDVLARLIHELGITDATIPEALAEARTLAQAAAAFTRNEPEAAQRLFVAMAEYAELDDLRKHLQQIAKNHD